MTLTTHLGAHALRPAQLIRVSHPRGLGLPGIGWERRLTRVDQMEILPGEDATRLRLTDLGLSERMRLGILDSVEEWIVHRAAATEVIAIKPDGAKEYRIVDLVRWVGAGTIDWEAGYTVWTPGALAEGYRRSWRIIRTAGFDAIVDVADQDVPDLGTVQVDEDFNDPVLGKGWALMRTDRVDASYRPDFIRAADKRNGTFESGQPGFQYSSH